MFWGPDLDLALRTYDLFYMTFVPPRWLLTQLRQFISRMYRNSLCTNGFLSTTPLTYYKYDSIFWLVLGSFSNLLATFVHSAQWAIVSMTKVCMREANELLIIINSWDKHQQCSQSKSFNINPAMRSFLQ